MCGLGFSQNKCAAKQFLLLERLINERMPHLNFIYVKLQCITTMRQFDEILLEYGVPICGAL